MPTLTVYFSWGTFTGFLGMCGVWSGVFHVLFAMITRTVPAQVLILTLRRAVDVAAFALVLGNSVLG